MKAEAMNLNQNDLGRAERRDEIIALAREVNAHFEEIHASMADILSRAPYAQAA